MTETVEKSMYKELTSDLTAKKAHKSTIICNKIYFINNYSKYPFINLEK